MGSCCTPLLRMSTNKPTTRDHCSARPQAPTAALQLTTSACIRAEDTSEESLVRPSFAAPPRGAVWPICPKSSNARSHWPLFSQALSAAFITMASASVRPACMAPRICRADSQKLLFSHALTAALKLIVSGVRPKLSMRPNKRKAWPIRPLFSQALMAALKLVTSGALRERCIVERSCNAKAHWEPRAQAFKAVLKLTVSGVMPRRGAKARSRNECSHFPRLASVERTTFKLVGSGAAHSWRMCNNAQQAQPQLPHFDAAAIMVLKPTTPTFRFESWAAPKTASARCH
mmetsp:Transcript_108171/g.304704  ORF Transcript_108171/g.304704 Transcript_108171/m.304704 type:complete len:288 (+) Transcript_108171:555-1418(+)